MLSELFIVGGIGGIRFRISLCRVAKKKKTYLRDRPIFPTLATDLKILTAIEIFRPQPPILMRSGENQGKSGNIFFSGKFGNKIFFVENQRKSGNFALTEVY